VGRERSRASGTYPEELCDKYARCAISQFLLMGKEEFLHYKEMMMKLKETIDGYKAKSEKASPGSNKASSQQSSPARAQSAHREKQAKTDTRLWGIFVTLNLKQHGRERWRPRRFG